MTPAETLNKRGWITFAQDAQLARWVDAALPVARQVAADPEIRSQWLRCGGTWFAGVNAFPNDATGAVPDKQVPALAGQAVDFIADDLGLKGVAWDAAQISVCYPGYPQPSDAESEAAFRYRRDRDAAHVDGLRRSDPGRRRFPSEAHAFILGIPLNAVPDQASPMVVWEGSHDIMGSALRERLAGINPDAWHVEDVTDAYTEARRKVFETCTRVTVTAQPGECYLVHRLALHGVARWAAAPGTATERIIAYFRPEADTGGLSAAWLA